MLQSWEGKDIPVKNSAVELAVAHQVLVNMPKEVRSLVVLRWFKFLAGKGYAENAGADYTVTQKFWDFFESHKEEIDGAVLRHMVLNPDSDMVTVAAIEMAGLLFKEESMTVSAKSFAELDFLLSGFIKTFDDPLFKKWSSSNL